VPAVTTLNAGPEGGSTPPQRLHGWLHPAILAAAALSVASGYAQFGVFTALADVGRAFGHAEATGAAGVGLSGTALGIGLGIIRFAALGGLPLSSMADHRGRRRVLLACCGLGLAITAAASASPAYWVFIALFALGRPLLSATNAIAGVIAAEETRVKDRAKAIALITAAYGTGAGIPAMVRAVDARFLDGFLGFRGLFALSLVPLLLLPLIARRIEEPDRFVRALRSGSANRLALAAVEPALRGRLAMICGLTFAATFAATPVNGYVFAYAEGVLGVTPTFTFAIVLAAGVTGFFGLVVGRWAADIIGRRVTCATMHVVAGAAGYLAYRGSLSVAVTGYLIGIVAGSAFAPALGALSAEIFPTAERATAAGWITAASALGAVGGLVAFGVLVDTLGGFAAAALTVSVPVVVTAPLYLLLPETRGMELEESAPDPALERP
jgi:putative MFS transporter